MSIDKHDKTVRLRLTVDLCTDQFQDWLVGEVELRRLNGWMRPRIGGVEVVLAGDAGSVESMMALLTGDLCPEEVRGLEKRPLRGDEPVWSGFHRLPSF